MAPLASQSRASNHVAIGGAGTSVMSAEGQGAHRHRARDGAREVAETGVMVHGDLSADLLLTIFSHGPPSTRGRHHP
jgi:hypothetical protein